MRKNRFTIIKTDRLNPETLQNDVDIWVVKDTATGHWISEHDTAKGANALCELLNDINNDTPYCIAHYFPTEKQP